MCMRNGEEEEHGCIPRERVAEPSPKLFLVATIFKNHQEEAVRREGVVAADDHDRGIRWSRATCHGHSLYSPTAL